MKATDRFGAWVGVQCRSRQGVRKIATILLILGLAFAYFPIDALVSGQVDAGRPTKTYYRATQPDGYWFVVLYLSAISLGMIGFGSFGMYRSFADRNLEP